MDDIEYKASLTNNPEGRKCVEIAQLGGKWRVWASTRLDKILEDEGIDRNDPPAFAPFEEPENLNVPGINLGTCHFTECLVAIASEEYKRGGIIVVGQTGAGKTNAALQIAAELLKQNEHPVNQ